MNPHEALNFQLTVLLASFCLGPLTFVLRLAFSPNAGDGTATPAASGLSNR
jgi:hypothetical protein